MNFKCDQMKRVHITYEDAEAMKVHWFQRQPRELFAEGISWCINGMLAPVPMVTDFSIIIISSSSKTALFEP
jgi:hypothetical protein